ncbi:hypothetical protein BJ878DRAFT_534840 [Calycina marina]|uniref:Uncharacterized protein n=1 Tax=Calycina marina TaxID=1763456 RepID=A0A9P7Z2D8_9HELO|nr:hypothetical protein BJ878DRAFT_534840 [Calycina marina]
MGTQVFKERGLGKQHIANGNKFKTQNQENTTLGGQDSLIAPPKKVRPLGPIFKPKTKTKEVPPIKDNFPLLGNTENGTLPAVPSWNKPPVPHASEQTPLFIGFTRNWPILQQCVLSYIAAGWPPEDIYVVDNTGTMKSNFPPKPKLTLQNPFYLNVQRLTDVFGVNVISTPTLLTFAQLQNFYIFTAIEHHWDYYFWGHMDIIVLAEERYKGVPYKSFYQRALDKVKEVSSPQYLRNSVSGQQDEWGIQFFAYDWLALNNVKSFLKIGAWDTFISYYTADCDTHARFTMNGIKMPLADAGRVSDVGGPIDLNLLFRRKIDPQHPPQTVHELDKLPEDECGGPGFDLVIAAVKEQVDVKKNAKLRNAWQNAQVGGQGEPFYRDPEGFQQALEMIISNGVNTYQAKWGHRECNLVESGLHPNHAWKVEKDWDEKE